jgi:hypothetical protein
MTISFDPIGPQPPVRKPAEPEWRIILPAPADAPAPPAKHPKLGTASHRWEYRDSAGRLLGFVCRFNLPKASKEIRGLVFAEHRKWGRQWRWLGFPKPRPLYGLDCLAAHPGAVVIITEGEKAADAAGALLPDHVTITSPGGSKAAKMADWSALAGRQVVIWPDADDPGQVYARDVVDMLAKLSPAPMVAIIKAPEGAAEGWDAADALAEGWNTARAIELIAAAVPAATDHAPGAQQRKSNRDWLIALLEDAETRRAIGRRLREAPGAVCRRHPRRQPRDRPRLSRKQRGSRLKPFAGAPLRRRGACPLHRDGCGDRAARRRFSGFRARPAGM